MSPGENAAAAIEVGILLFMALIILLELLSKMGKKS